MARNNCLEVFWDRSDLKIENLSARTLNDETSFFFKKGGPHEAVTQPKLGFKCRSSDWDKIANGSRSVDNFSFVALEQPRTGSFSTNDIFDWSFNLVESN